MKYLFILMLAAGAAVSTQSFAQVRKGDAMPDLTLSDIQGKRLSVSSLRGSVVLVDFWASWCRPCREKSPELVRLYAKYASKGLQIVGVSLDDNTTAWQRAVKADRMTWPQVIVPASDKNRILSTFGVAYIPATFLVDRKGVLQEADLQGDALEEAVRRLLQ